MTANASSGLAVSFTSTTPSVCSIGGSTVTSITAGTCNIAASQSGNDRYNASPQVTQSITIAKASQTLSFGAAPSIAIGGTGTLLATATSGLTLSFSTTSPSICTVNGSTITGVAAGTCTITANQAGNTNYSAAPQATQTLSVGKLSQSISFGPAPELSVGAPTLVWANATSGLAVSFSSNTTNVCTVSGSNVTAILIGTCIIAANQAGNASYNAADVMTLSVTATGRKNTAPTFAIRDGNVTTEFGGNAFGQSTIVQSDGRIIVMGGIYFGNSSGSYRTGFALARYNTDGSLDATFGTDGKVTTDISEGWIEDGSGVMQSDGKLVVAGLIDVFSGGAGIFNIALARYNTDGSLDTTFGTEGKVNNEFSTGWNLGSSVAMQMDGKILVSGENNWNFALARYNSNGSLDTSFGTGGKVTTDFGGFESSTSMIVQPDGQILVTGRSSTTTFGGTFVNVALARYNMDGSLDTSFGTGGKVSTVSLFASSVTKGNSTLQPDGKILVAGTAATAGGIEIAVARYNTNGSLDTSFGTGGKVTVPYWYEGESVVVQPDGKIVVSGNNGSRFGFVVARINANGSLDTTFGTDGKVNTRFNSIDSGRSVILQSDGKILLGGNNEISTNHTAFALARYNSDGSLDTRFGGVSTLISMNCTPFTASTNCTPNYTKGAAAVVLDSNVRIFDTELSIAGNYAGATLTISRHGGTSAEDVFSNTGTLGVLTEGGNLTVGGGTIGTVTKNSDGTLTLTFNNVANQTLVDMAMQRIAYKYNANIPPGSVRLDWTFNDGNSGVQGSGGALAVTDFSTVGITFATPAVSLAATSAVQKEGNSGTTPFTFTATRSGDISGSSSLTWTVSGSGANPANAADFVGGVLPSGTVSFAAGQSTATITVNVAGDNMFEMDEGFTVTLSKPVAAALGTSTTSASITDSATGGYGVTEHYYTLAGGGGTFALNYDMYSAPDKAAIYLNSVLVASTNGAVSGAGTLTIPSTNALRAGDVIDIVMTGVDNGTAWDYTVSYQPGVQVANYIATGVILNDDAAPGNTIQTIGAISFSPSTLAAGGSTTVSAASSSGLAVTFTSATLAVCAASGSTVTGIVPGVCTIAADQAGNPTYNMAAQVTQSISVGGAQSTGTVLNVMPAWNLMGNGVNVPLTVATAFGDASKVTTVWKWIAATARWAFYTPLQTDGGAAYAASKGYDFLNSIGAGEGFWVNAKAAFTLPLLVGTAVSTTTFQDQSVPPNNLPSGWSLIAVGDSPTPSAFNKNISASPPTAGAVPINLTTLWAWDNTNASWYFYAPSLEANNGLAAYIASKSYLDFGAMTLSPTTGFWLNKP